MLTRFSGALVAMAAAGTLLIGCSSGVAGSPAAVDETSEEPLTSSVAFGDLRTIDPCGLTEAAAFEDHGSASMPGKPSMDTCTVPVSTDEGGVTVRVGELQPLELLSDQRRDVADLPRGASIVQVAAASGGVCTMALVLADDVVLLSVARADQVDTVSDTTVCGIAQGGVRGAYEIIEGDRVTHWEPEPDSLAGTVACDLLSADQVAGQLGITPDVVTSYPAEHQCRWGRTGGDTATAKLAFPIGADHRDVGVPETSPKEILGGRESWVAETTTESIGVCSATTEHVEFGLGSGLREYATLHIAVPVNAGKDACAIVRELAGAAWAELPPPPT